MIKTVAFDLGNVILPFDLVRLAEGLKPYTAISKDDIIAFMWNLETANEFETGKMSGEEYVELVTQRCQFKNLPSAEFIRIFNDIFQLDQQVDSMIKQLKGQVNLGLISNINPIHADHIMKTYDTLDHFDHILFSHEGGVRKPDPEIYHMMLKYFSMAPEEVVFIDDMHENITSAKEVGINVVHYKDAGSLKNELVRFGVLSDC